MMTLHLAVQAAHPTLSLVRYEPVLDQSVEGRREHALNSQLRFNFLLEEGATVQLNYKCTSPAN